MKDLTLVMSQSSASKVTFECELYVLKDRRHGQQEEVRLEKQEAGIIVVAADDVDLTVKKGRWAHEIEEEDQSQEIRLGEPLTVSCISKAGIPNLTLSLFLNGDPWPTKITSKRLPSGKKKVTGAVCNFQRVICFIYLGWTVVEGHRNNVTDIDFGPHDILEVECKADHSKKELGKEQLRLRKKQDCVCTCGTLTVSCTRPLLAALITTFYYLSQ